MGATFKRLGPKIVKRTGYYNCGPTLAHWCPACKEMHDFAVDQPFGNGARWTWNENPAAPSFTPSMNIRIGPYPEGCHRAGTTEVCHYFLKDGQIQFLTDCTHDLAGKVVELPDIPATALKYATEESA